MKQISIVHQGALGDTVLLIPLVRSLRKRFAEGVKITLVTRPNLGQMLKMMGFIDAYASAEDREHTLWFAPPTGHSRGRRQHITATEHAASVGGL